MRILTGTIQVENLAETLREVNEIAKTCNSATVIVDAAKVAGIKHIETAVEHAKRSFDCGTAISRTLSMEILVYASGQRQCSLASKFGLHVGKNAVYVVIVGGDETHNAELIRNGIMTEGPVELANSAVFMKEFNITKEELSVVGADRVEELVIERVALVDAWK